MTGAGLVGWVAIAALLALVGTALLWSIALIAHGCIARRIERRNLVKLAMRYGIEPKPSDTNWEIEDRINRRFASWRPW